MASTVVNHLFANELQVLDIELKRSSSVEVVFLHVKDHIEDFLLLHHGMVVPKLERNSVKHAASCFLLHEA